MRRAPAWMAVLGVLFAWLGTPASAHAAGVWVTLAAGLPGVDTPTSSSEFFFDNPHAPFIAVNQLTGGVSAEAATGGGSSFFGGAGTPVLLNLADGSSYIANGAASPAARTSGAGGGTAASAAPVAGGDVPSNAALLGISVAEPKNDGSRTLIAGITAANGNPLGSGLIEIPDGGWWVIGLGPNAVTPPPPIDPPPPVDPIPDPPVANPPPPPPPSPGTGGVAAPEPGTFAIAAIGASVLHAWRRGRLKPAV